MSESYNLLSIGLETSDLINEGSIGLLEAIARFRPETGNRIPTYAVRIIKGRMIDALRKYGPYSRKSLLDLKKITPVLDRTPIDRVTNHSIEFISAKSGFTTRRVAAALQLLAIKPISLESARTTRDGKPQRLADTIPLTDQNIGEIIEADQSSQILKKLGEFLNTKPPRIRRLLNLRYNDGQSYRKIGEELDISETRVKQLHDSAIGGFRRVLNETPGAYTRGSFT